MGIPGPLSDIWPFGDLVFTSYRPTDVEELGVFGEVTVDLDDQWSVVLGSRWFDTMVTFSEQQAGLAADVPLAEDVPLSSIPAEGGMQQENGFIFKAIAEYTETVAGVVEEGDPLQFVPEWTGSLIADYTAANAIANMDLIVRADLSYMGDSLSTVNAIARERDAYEQLSLRVSLSNDRYRATLYAKSLTNTIANLGDNRSIAAETPGRPRWVVSRPRMIGLEVGVNF